MGLADAVWQVSRTVPAFVGEGSKSCAQNKITVTEGEKDHERILLRTNADAFGVRIAGA